MVIVVISLPLPQFLSLFHCIFSHFLSLWGGRVREMWWSLASHQHEGTIKILSPLERLSFLLKYKLCRLSPLVLSILQCKTKKQQYKYWTSEYTGLKLWLWIHFTNSCWRCRDTYIFLTQLLYLQILFLQGIKKAHNRKTGLQCLLLSVQLSGFEDFFFFFSVQKTKLLFKIPRSQFSCQNRAKSSFGGQNTLRLFGVN